MSIPIRDNNLISLNFIYYQTKYSMLLNGIYIKKFLRSVWEARVRYQNIKKKVENMVGMGETPLEILINDDTYIRKVDKFKC